MTGLRVIDEWPGGFGWIAHPDEYLKRASHAVKSPEGLWLIDPVETDQLADLLATRDPVAGVLVTLDRHTRDADQLARKHDVRVCLPNPLSHLRREFDAPTSTLGPFTRATGFSASIVLDLPGWREVALYDGTGGTLLVGDTLGTAPYFSPPGERLSVHPMLRLVPPAGRFIAFAPERILVGHGEGIMEGGSDALRAAFSAPRRGIPRAWMNALLEGSRASVFRK